MSTQSIGKTGENAVAELYKSEGFCILKQNYRTRFGEIDLVAQNTQYLVFVEVKTRRPDAKISGYEAVDYHKQKRIVAAANGFIQQFGQTECFVRFDVVEVLHENEKILQISKVENAFCL